MHDVARSWLRIRMTTARVAACEALGRSEAPSAALPALSRTALDTDGSPQLRTAALRAVGHLGSSRARATLREVATDQDPTVAAAADTALAQLAR